MGIVIYIDVILMIIGAKGMMSGEMELYHYKILTFFIK